MRKGREPGGASVDRVELEVRPRRPVAGQPIGESAECAPEALGAAPGDFRVTHASALDGEGRAPVARGQLAGHESRRLESLIDDRRDVP